ncbi:hypothetical protein PS720_05022 [Pseudomonas fluorescens]|nr:hypothetical protein PS720_05022 [Pseudomonas fluorescens]
MGVEQGAGGDDEVFALGRQPHMPGRAFEQAIAEAFFQALELEADRRLGGVEGFGGAGKTGEIGHPYESLDGVDVQRFERVSHIQSLSHLYRLISC